MSYINKRSITSSLFYANTKLAILLLSGLMLKVSNKDKIFQITSQNNYFELNMFVIYLRLVQYKCICFISGILFVYKIKRNGPSKLLWETPTGIFGAVECSSFGKTTKFLLFMYERIKFNRVSGVLFLYSLWINSSCYTVSKTFSISNIKKYLIFLHRPNCKRFF